MSKYSGIGVDIIEIERIKRIISGKYGIHFLKNNFHEEELSYINSKHDSTNHIATTFAAKEAVFKCLGTGWIDGKQIKIIRETSGKPFAVVKNSNEEILLSLSYDTQFAIAFAVRKNK